MKKNFIKVIAIIIGFFILASFSIYNIIKFKAYQLNQTKKEKNFEQLISAERVAYNKLNQELEGLKLKTNELEEKTFSEIIEIKKILGLKIGELQKKLIEEKAQRAAVEAQIEAGGKKLTELEKVISQTKPYDLVSIINNWRQRIAYLECSWGEGDEIFTITGSGILISDKNKNISILTSKHMVVEDMVIARLCQAVLPNYKKTIDIVSKNVALGHYDWAKLNIYDPDEYIKNTAFADFNICLETPSLGDSVVILGYPRIGAEADVTATEGIIAGYEGDYYITSAKIEQGNSGGAAILLKNNCYLGIPTFVKAGLIESLGRILKSELIF